LALYDPLLKVHRTEMGVAVQNQEIRTPLGLDRGTWGELEVTLVPSNADTYCTYRSIIVIVITAHTPYKTSYFRTRSKKKLALESDEFDEFDIFSGAVTVESEVSSS
jgi:hypothetical protein